MIIDCHAHLVAPPVFYAYRANLQASGQFHRGSPGVSDDLLSEFAGSNVSTMDGVGTDFQLISPRPYHQMQSVKPTRLVDYWIEANNDLIHRTVQMHPTRFAGVAGLPICAGEPVTRALAELERTVNQLGFVGILINPDPYEGKGPSPTLDDEYWYPLYEAMVDLGVPALIHSSGCESGRETYSEHFITEESIAILSLIRGRVFDRFPDLKIIVSHGGGSVPYQIGRWRAEVLHPSLGGKPGNPSFDSLLRPFYFDTVLHHKLALELLFKTVGSDRCLFGTENPGSGSAPNAETGRPFDDLRPVIESMDFLSSSDRSAIFEDNAREIFPRLKARLP